VDIHTIVLQLLRWIHFLAGITWIGHLYFFNLVNGPFQTTIDADTKKKVNPQLLLRALFWFRWGAMFTVLAGLTYLFWKQWIASDAGLFGVGGLWNHSSYGAWITLGGLLGLFFALLTMHVILQHWPRIVELLEDVSPLRREYTRALLEEFRRVGRTTLSGTVLTGLIQGVLAALGFWLCGVPRPLFLGIATALASLVPAIGTLLVWVPAGLYLFAASHPAAAVGMLAWGAAVVVGFSDYVIRPRLVSDEGMPAILTFLALFGGLEVLGLAGLVAGPMIMALAVSVLRLYAREARARGADG